MLKQSFFLRVQREQFLKGCVIRRIYFYTGHLYLAVHLSYVFVTHLGGDSELSYYDLLLGLLRSILSPIYCLGTQ